MSGRFELDPVTGLMKAKGDTILGGQGYVSGSTVTPEQYGTIINRDLETQKLQLSKEMAPWQKGFGLANAGLGLASALMGYKQYELDKDKFGFQKQLAEADYTAKAKAFNEELGRASDVGLALAGSTATPEMKQAAANRLKEYSVATKL